MSEPCPKCCWVCGRWGNRAFTWNPQAEMWACSNDRACERRVNDPNEETK